MKSYIIILAVLFVSCFGLSEGADCPSADLTGDRVVDVNDINALTAEWLNDCNMSNDWCNGADIARNGTVNLFDFAVFAEQWFEDMRLDISNVLVIQPSDNIATKYNLLKSSIYDRRIGPLSATNRRSLLLSPGTYTMAYTVLMDTDYIDILPMIEGTVSIVKSGNSMGLVLLPNVKAVNMTAADDRLYSGWFNRLSVAYNEFDLYDVNEITTRPMPVMGFVTGTTENATEVIGGAPLTIRYQASGLGTPVLFGNYSNQIYKSTDGTNWFSAGAHAPPARIGNMWDADSLGNCVMSSDNYPPAIYYGTYDTNTALLTFTRAQKSAANGGGDFSITSTSLNAFNFIRLASGTLLLSEYGTFGRYIYRSTDKGHTWTHVYDPGARVITHWHGFGQLLSTGRIVVSSGDGTKAKIIYSDDDGLTWTNLTVAGTTYIQPINFLDFGHSSKLLVADDTQEGLFLFDVYSADITPIYFDQDRRNMRGFFWSFCRDGNDVYVSSYDTTTGGAGTSPCIYATKDLVHWSAIYRIAASTAYGTSKLIFFNGQIHGNINCYSAPASLHLAITPPPITSKYGVRVEQAVVNQCSDTGRSSFEDANYATYITGPDITVSQVNTATIGMPIPHGIYAVRVQKTSADFTTFITRNSVSPTYGIMSTTDSIYSGSFMLGVPPTGKATQFICKWVNNNGTAAADNSTLYANVQPGEWTTVMMPPCKAAAGETAVGFSIESLLAVGDLQDFLIDEVQITDANNQPTSWQLGGTTRAKSAYDFNWNTAAKATHIFSFCPLARSGEYTVYDCNMFIRSWVVSSTVHAQVYYDSNDLKFKLDITDGVSTETLATAAQVFKKGQPLIFVVQFGDNDDAKAHLSVGHGRAIETVDSTDAYTAFGSEDVLVRWGDKDSDNGLNGTLYDIDFTGAIAPENIVDYVGSKIEQER